MVVSVMVFALLFSFHVSYAIDLDRPPGKEIIIEEIERGFFDVSSLRGSCSNISHFRERIDKVLKTKKGQNANTEAFQLGANLEAWSMMDLCANILEKQGHPDYQLAGKWAKIFFDEMRKLQRRIRIDDETLIEVRGLDHKTWKEKISRYIGLKN